MADEAVELTVVDGLAELHERLQGMGPGKERAEAVDLTRWLYREAVLREVQAMNVRLWDRLAGELAGDTMARLQVWLGLCEKESALLDFLELPPGVDLVEVAEEAAELVGVAAGLV